MDNWISALVCKPEFDALVSTFANNAGQVKVRFSDLGATGFTANTAVNLSVRSATATVLDSPTTVWPHQSVKDLTNSYDLGFFIQGSDESSDRLRENNIMGQVHRWRVAGTYSNKSASNQGRLRCFLFNPDTGFRVSSNVILPSGVTDDDFTFEFTSIADNDSLSVGRGYQVGFQTSFSDSNLAVSINSIVRISEAVELSKVVNN